jgi:RHS repeat-associated protein
MREGTSGLYYVRARYYDSDTGRFLSRDRAASLDPALINPYQFARGNPLRYVDVNGLSPEETQAPGQRVRMVFYNGDLGWATRSTLWAQGGYSFSSPQDIIDQIEQNLGPNDVLGTIEILDHSGCAAFYTAGSMIAVVGDQLHYDPGMQEFLTDLKQYFDENSAIIINQCSVAETARGETLLQLMANETGARVYGPTTDQTNSGFLGAWDLYKFGFVYRDPQQPPESERETVREKSQ